MGVCSNQVPITVSLTYINYAVVTVAGARRRKWTRGILRPTWSCSPGSHAVQPVHAALLISAYRLLAGAERTFCGYGDDSRVG